MKFILCEDKFLLKENPSFILEERFILDEEILLEAQATLKQLVIDLNKLDTLLPSITEVLPVGLELKILDGTALEGEKLGLEKEIQKHCEDLQDLLTGSKNFKELIDKIRAKAAKSPEETFSEEEIKILQPLCYNIASDGISVKDRLKGIKSHKGELAEQVATLQERLPKLKTNIEELYKFFDKKPAEETPEDDEAKPKYSLKTTTVKIKVGTTFTLKILATPKPKEAVKAVFTSENTKIATVDEKGVITANAKGTTKIKVEVGDQTLGCTVLALASAVDERGENDWYDLYKRCEKCENVREANEAFWNGGLPKEGDPNPKNLPIVKTNKMALGYYKGEWGEHSELVDSFGTSFIKTLKELGWTEVLNPYIALLRHLFKFEKVWINGASWAAVFKAVADGAISEDDLRGSGKLGELDLVRNPLFYTKSGKEISEYLNWQKEAKNAESKVPSDTANGLKTVYANIVSAEVESSSIDLKDNKAYAVISGANFQYKIRPLVKYKEIIKIYLKVDGDKKKVVQATDEEVTAILSKITTKETAKKVLAYIVNYFRVAKLSALDALFAEDFGDKLKANRDEITTTFEEDKRFDKLLQVTSKKYSEEQLKTLVSELLKTAGLST